MMEKEEKKVTGAYEKAAEEGIDPRCIPQTLNSLPPVGDEIVTPPLFQGRKRCMGVSIQSPNGSS
jgi:hypothetical protein